MCYACTQCGKCGKFGEGANLASQITIPCLICGGEVESATGVCMNCGHHAFVPVTANRARAAYQSLAPNGFRSRELLDQSTN